MGYDSLSTHRKGRPADPTGKRIRKVPTLRPGHSVFLFQSQRIHRIVASGKTDKTHIPPCIGNNSRTGMPAQNIRAPTTRDYGSEGAVSDTPEEYKKDLRLEMGDSENKKTRGY